MTLAGGLTANGTVNANGGVNIPLAVGAPTDTAAVNRLHAAGLAGVTDIFFPARLPQHGQHYGDRDGGNYRSHSRPVCAG